MTNTTCDRLYRVYSIIDSFSVYLRCIQPYQDTAASARAEYEKEKAEWNSKHPTEKVSLQRIYIEGIS